MSSSNGWGGRRPGSGRKGKVEEQTLIERLSPLEPIAHAKLKKAIEDGERWAIKLFFEYRYGKPRQTHEVQETVSDTISIYFKD